MRYERVEDILRLALSMELSYQGISIQDIQDMFEVSRRTAVRMKDAVIRLFPNIEEVVNSSSRVKKWRLTKSPLQKMICFTAEEFAELENCKSLLKNLNYTNRCDLIDEIILKIKTVNKQKTAKVDVEALLEAEGFAIRQSPRYKVSTDILNVVSEGIKAFKCVEFDYPSSKEGTRQIEVEPYGFVYGEKTYLLAYNEYSKGLRYYSFDKIKNPKVLEKYFEKDEKFNIKNYLQNSFGVFQEEPMKIKLEFKKEVAESVLNYNFHPSQKISLNEDGSVSVNFKAGGTYEICWHLFKWGDKVKILAPKFLKDTYRELLQKATQSIE